MNLPVALAELSGQDFCRGIFTGYGLRDSTVGDKAQLIGKSAQGLLRNGVPDKAQVNVFYVPGRIEVLGKHTDYAGGRSIITAVEQGFCLISYRRDDSTVTVFAADTEDAVEFPFAAEINPPMGHWSNYPMTVARRLAKNFAGPLHGADIAFASDLPPASGMSSSSAFMIAIFLALSHINQLGQHREYLDNIDSTQSLAGYLGTVENGKSFGTLTGDTGAGIFGGSEDHTAILCCQAGKLSQYSYCPVNFERFIDLPGGYIFAVSSSGVIAEKTGAVRQKYNRLSLLASAATEIWQQVTGRTDPHLAAILASAPDAADQLRTVLRQSNHSEYSPDDLLRRFEQFYAEHIEIIPTAGDALIADHIEQFGQLIDRSQQLGRELLGIPQTNFLAQSARQLGAVAASAFGGGFGGSIWALIAVNEAEDFLQKWSRQYQLAFPEPAGRAAFFLTQPGPAAYQLA